MNNISLAGRLATDVDFRETQGGTARARFRLAVRRSFVREGQPDVDFFTVICFGKTADFVQNNFHKGRWAGVTGRLQNRKYESQGQEKEVAEVIANELNFVGPPPDAQPAREPAPTTAAAPQRPQQPPMKFEDFQDDHDPFEGE